MILFGVDQATELACPVDTPSFHPVSSEKAVLIFCRKKKKVGFESTSTSFIYKSERRREKPADEEGFCTNRSTRKRQILADFTSIVDGWKCSFSYLFRRSD
jgi:hypothetical protein